MGVRGSGLVEDSVTPVPADEVVSVRRATVENCIPHFGCLSVTYPYVRLVLRGDGTYSVSDGE